MSSTRPSIPDHAVDLRTYQDIKIPQWLLPQLKSLSFGQNGLLTRAVVAMAIGDLEGEIAVAFKKDSKTILAWCLRADRDPGDFHTKGYRYMLYTRNSYRRQGLGTKVFRHLEMKDSKSQLVFTDTVSATGFWDSVHKKSVKI